LRALLECFQDGDDTNTSRIVVADKAISKACDDITELRASNSKKNQRIEQLEIYIRDESSCVPMLKKRLTLLDRHVKKTTHVHDATQGRMCTLVSTVTELFPVLMALLKDNAIPKQKVYSDKLSYLYHEVIRLGRLYQVELDLTSLLGNEDFYSAPYKNLKKDKDLNKRQRGEVKESKGTTHTTRYDTLRTEKSQYLEARATKGDLESVQDMATKEYTSSLAEYDVSHTAVRIVQQRLVSLVGLLCRRSKKSKPIHVAISEAERHYFLAYYNLLRNTFNEPVTPLQLISNTLQEIEYALLNTNKSTNEETWLSTTGKEIT
jgi:hypothetical protein